MKALITLLSLIGMIITFAVPTASLAAPVSPSLYLIGKAGTGSGRLEVHILNGANNFQSYLLHTATPQHLLGANWGWIAGVN